MNVNWSPRIAAQEALSLSLASEIKSNNSHRTSHYNEDDNFTDRSIDLSLYY